MYHRSKKKRSEAENRLDALYREIRERICLLEYRPGERLNEGRLAEEFGVSRTPIRRVLTSLESEGLIETHHGDGTYVTSLTAEYLEDVYAFRIELAPLIGKLTPLQPSSETLDKLRKTRDAIAELIGKPQLRQFAKLNIDYYMTVTGLIGNLPLREVMQRLFFQTSRIWLMELPNLDWDEAMRSSAQEITYVINALELGDMEAVGLVSRMNLRRTRARYLPVDRESISPNPVHIIEEVDHD